MAAITWHSPAEMLPQAGQEIWIQLVDDGGSKIRAARFLHGGYGTDPLCALGTRHVGCTVIFTRAFIKGWCPREAINLD
jgi:hypothetical protein